jgi:Spy/CpxP family protein refolding chaperone
LSAERRRLLIDEETTMDSIRRDGLAGVQARRRWTSVALASTVVVGLGVLGAGCEAENAASAPAASPAASAPAPGMASAPPAPTAPPMAAASAAPPASAAPMASAPPANPGSPEQAEGDEHRERHHGGVLGLIAMSLADLELTPEQHTSIDKIRDDFVSKAGPAHAAGQDLATTLADGVAAGAVDRAKADAAIGKLVTQVQALHDAGTAALDDLHAALTPPQRAALVADVQSHWDKWKEAQGQDEKADGQHHPGHLLALVRKLGLSQEQAEKIKASFHDKMKATPQDTQHKDVDDYLKAFGTAFKADTFHAKTLTKGKAAATHMARWGATRMERFLEAATPILTPDQRTKLAEMLKHHEA